MYFEGTDRLAHRRLSKLDPNSILETLDSLFRLTVLLDCALDAALPFEVGVFEEVERG